MSVGGDGDHAGTRVVDNVDAAGGVADVGLAAVDDIEARRPVKQVSPVPPYSFSARGPPTNSSRPEPPSSVVKPCSMRIASSPLVPSRVAIPGDRWTP
jgi:hypothetical protein